MCGCASGLVFRYPQTYGFPIGTGRERFRGSFLSCSYWFGRSGTNNAVHAVRAGCFARTADALQPAEHAFGVRYAGPAERCRRCSCTICRRAPHTPTPAGTRPRRSRQRLLMEVSRLATLQAQWGPRVVHARAVDRTEGSGADESAGWNDADCMADYQARVFRQTRSWSWCGGLWTKSRSR